MSAAAVVGPILSIAAKIAEWVDEGLDNDAIRKRLADPSHVGDDLLDGVRERREIGERLLGRGPG